MTKPVPWWETDPTLVEIRRRTAEEFGIDLDGAEPELDDDGVDLDDREPDLPEGPDPVLSDIWDGACTRELARARDASAHARDRYDAAVLKARTAGLSWGEIGNVLGVSRQQLHRRFGVRRRS